MFIILESRLIPLLEFVHKLEIGRKGVLKIKFLFSTLIPAFKEGLYC